MSYFSRPITIAITVVALVITSADIPTLAAENIPVSATVPSASFNAPTLLSPSANATLNTLRPTFSWQRPSPTPTSPLRHYDLYLDDTVFASSISDSLTSSDYYFYTATASSGVFYVSLKTDLAEGYHTWKVVAFTESGSNATSETRTFYIDSIAPYITVTQVDKQTLSWDTRVAGSIPDVSKRYLQVTRNDPLIKGGIEASSNIQVILTCPTSLKNCQNQVYTGNISSGLWETRFSSLVPGYTYTVTISGTDAASNSTIFPDFYLTYGQTIVITPTPTITTTPTTTPSATITPPRPLPSATPSASLSGLPVITPPPGESNIIEPGTYVPRVPLAPTPPPVKPPSQTYAPLDLIYFFLLILMLFGLPLHLFMVTWGAAIRPSFILKFLVILIFPFVRKRTHLTTPFTCLNFFSASNLTRSWQSTVSDIHGFYRLKSSPPDTLYIQLSTWGRSWKNSLLRSHYLNTSCLSPLPQRPLSGRQRLQKQLYDYRTIPLVMAIITSSIALPLKPSYFVLIYLYLSLQCLYSEYFYKPSAEI